MNIRNEARPKSTGSFISQLREIDRCASCSPRPPSARRRISLYYSVPVHYGLYRRAAGDYPAAGDPADRHPRPAGADPDGAAGERGLREGALRNAVLVETIEGVEDIKALQAEPYFQRQWEQTHEVSAAIGMKQRLWGARLTGWASSVQQLTYAGMLVFGTYLVPAGDITTGTLVASSLLSSRTIAPLMQLTMIFSRWQHAKSAMTGLDELLKSRSTSRRRRKWRTVRR